MIDGFLMKLPCKDNHFILMLHILGYKSPLLLFLYGRKSFLCYPGVAKSAVKANFCCISFKSVSLVWKNE